MLDPSPLLRFAFALCLAPLAGAQAPQKLELHGLFADGAVLQREKPLRIFGNGVPGNPLIVTLSPQLIKQTRTGADGRWSVEFPALKTGTPIEHILVRDLTTGKQVKSKDILLGDVWVLGGQSNMEFELHKVYDGDLEILSANHPNIRLMTVPKGAGPEKRRHVRALNEFNSWAKYYEQKGSWRASTPKTVRNFSANGYLFGVRLHLATRVPIGLIDASRGGTCVETWTSRETLAQIEGTAKLNAQWDARAASFDPAADLAQQMKNWERRAAQQRKQGKKPGPKPKVRPGPALDMNRPSNCYNGMLFPLAGFAVRGAIWNQGYNNALADARPRLYAQVFQAMIRDWRRLFRDEQLPFGIIGFSAGGQPQTAENFQACMVDAAPFIREAQFRAAREMKSVGYIASWDQQMNWYHPFKKAQLSERIARWALATTAGKKLPFEPAALIKHEVKGDQIVLTFDRNVATHDSRDFEGFAIAGENRLFYPTRGTPVVKGKDRRGRNQYQRNQITVSHPLVRTPVAVRFAWARNPLGNGVTGAHHGRDLPIPGFRTDDWDLPEAPIAPNNGPKIREHRKKLRELKRRAQKWDAERKIAEARHVLEAHEAAKARKKAKK